MLFCEEKISLDILSQMNQEDLKSIGVATVGERHIILKGIKEFYSQELDTGMFLVNQTYFRARLLGLCLLTMKSVSI